MSATIGFSRRLSPLPGVLTPLLGRARESDQLRTLLLEPSNRLVTLTGPGGVGKTRLALHVASTLLDDVDDLVYVPLASIHDPDLVLPVIGQAMGMFSDVHDAWEDHLVEALQDQRMLLVLDNLEQVLGAAPSLAHVLARCPDTTMLVTSQAALGIAGEQLYPLQPLATPAVEQSTAEDIVRSDAVALFLQRAHAVNPNLAVDDRTARTIAEICRKLDGLPLALELAAARINILSPDALLARLSNRLQVLGGERRGVPDRLRTMRHAIAWSYDLLTPHEQALFRRMSVFVGGISLDAVEAIFRVMDDGRDAFDVLGTLVDHSLVTAAPLPSGEARFLMLETIRDYGLEQLELLGEDDQARLAHATFFVELGEMAEPYFVGSEQQAWLDRLDPESENVRAAVDWSIAHGQAEIALRIGGAIWRFCATRGLIADCRSWLERALAAPESDQSPYRARALIGVGNLAEDQRDLDAAQGYFEQSRTLAAASGNAMDECRAYLGLGIVAHDRSEYDAALDFHTRAAALARDAGDRRSIAIAVGNMAVVSYYLGKLDDAERFWEEGRVILASLGDMMAEATALSNLGSLAFNRGDVELAETRLTHALELQRRMKSARDLPFTLSNLGEVWTRLGDYTLAHDCFAEAITLFRQSGSTALEGMAVHGFAELAFVQGDLIAAAGRLLECVRLMEDLGDPRAMAEIADLLASLCSAHGNHAGAVELMAATDGIRRELGADPTPPKQARLDAIEAAARSALKEREYASAWAAGSEMDAETLPRRIGIVAREIIGTRQVSPMPSAPAAPPAPEEPAVDHNLTAREIEVLRLLAQGQSTREISEALFISPRTTATHVTNILGKLGLTSRTAAVAYAMRTGLV
jgi:predicted ATPase/DNA-binding CsgD family transcriptional regulator